MTTLPDFDMRCGSEYNEAIAKPENIGASALLSFLTPRRLSRNGLMGDVDLGEQGADKSQLARAEFPAFDRIAFA
jgi:hypothetical protein